MLNIPNALTLLRILAVPVFLSLLVEGEAQFALIVFILAGITDAVDGAIARMYDMRTELGAHLDPLADKLLVVSSFIALGIQGAVPLPLMIVVLTRDAVILGGYLFTAAVVGQAMAMAPSIWGKLTTFTQLGTMTLVLLKLAGWWSAPEGLMFVIFVLTGIASFISGGDYFFKGMRYYLASLEETD